MISVPPSRLDTENARRPQAASHSLAYVLRQNHNRRKLPAGPESHDVRHSVADCSFSSTLDVEFRGPAGRVPQAEDASAHERTPAIVRSAAPLICSCTASRKADQLAPRTLVVAPRLPNFCQQSFVDKSLLRCSPRRLFQGR